MAQKRDYSGEHADKLMSFVNSNLKEQIKKIVPPEVGDILDTVNIRSKHLGGTYAY